MDIRIQAFVNAIKSGKLTIDQVPEKYRQEVAEEVEQNVNL